MTSPGGVEVVIVASRDGTDIAVWRSGSGPPVVLVHGTTGDHDSFRVLAPVLGSEFTVLAMDRRGRGRSGDSLEYSIEREFEDVAAVVDSYGQPAVLFGHSFGATCALGGALHTDGISHLMLYEPDTGAIRVPAEILDGLDDMIARGHREQALLVILQAIVGLGPDEIEAMRSAPTWSARIAAVHTVPRELRAQGEEWFREDRFRSLETPTTLLVGTESPEWARRNVEAVTRVLPSSRTVELRGQAHSAHAAAPRAIRDHIAAAFA